MERLWGNNFFDPATKKWTTTNTGSATCLRGFVQFCYNPIKQVIEACMNDNRDKLYAMLEKLGVKDKLKAEDLALSGKPLMKRVMQTWLPAADALLEMVVFHLPSPATAQVYRVDTLYEGPLDDKYAQAMRTCDTSEDAPLMMYISKMIPSDGNRFIAFGRVFSGKVGVGSKVRIMGPNYVSGAWAGDWRRLPSLSSLAPPSTALPPNTPSLSPPPSPPPTPQAPRRTCTPSRCSALCCAWVGARTRSTTSPRATPAPWSAWTSSSTRTPPSRASGTRRRTRSRP